MKTIFAIYFTSKFQSSAPFVGVVMVTPDGRQIRLSNFALKDQIAYRVSQDTKLISQLNGVDPVIGLFAGPQVQQPDSSQRDLPVADPGRDF